jgi:glutamine synthetase
MVDGAWTGGTYPSWGRDTRETPVRLCGSPKNGTAHFEFRPLDGTANPYIALAGILGVGSKGIRDKAPLTIVGSGKETPAEMTEDARRKLGIVDRLPLNLADARLRLSQDLELNDLLGEVGKVWNNVNEVNKCRNSRTF